METIHIDDNVSQVIDQKLALLDTLQEKYNTTGDESLKDQMRKTAVEINDLLLKQANNGRTKT